MTPVTLRSLLWGGIALVLFAAAPAQAQQFTLDLGGSDSALATRSVQLIVIITILSLVPGIAIMVTCFPFIVTVLSILRQAIGLQQSPPNMLIISLALFLTYYVMEPVFLTAYNDGLLPLMDGIIPMEDGIARTVAPFREFMIARIDAETLAEMASLRPGVDPNIDPVDAPLSLIVPSFLISEVSRAFQVGFVIFLPFLIIDLVVAAILMSMGMMMVPPAIIAMPFKLAFFVVADGWSLIAASLVRGYTGG